MTLGVWPRGHAARANAIAERFVRTARTELLDHTLIWNEHQLRRLLTEYLEHYKSHRPHRGLQQRAPASIEHETPAPVPLGNIRRRRIHGGLINEYQPAA